MLLETLLIRLNHMTHSYREGRKVNQSGGAVTTERRFFYSFKNYLILSSPLAEARNGTLHFFSFSRVFGYIGHSFFKTQYQISHILSQSGLSSPPSPG